MVLSAQKWILQRYINIFILNTAEVKTYRKLLSGFWTFCFVLHLQERNTCLVSATLYHKTEGGRRVHKAVTDSMCIFLEVAW